MDSKSLFRQRAEEYARFRPNYPAGIVRILALRGCLGRQRVIADIGSGTGNLTALFASRGFRIYGVEPNDAMRTMAEEKLIIANQRFISWNDFRGTFLSSSGAPRPDAAGFADVLADLRRLFDAFAVNGRLLDDLVTELYLGRWSA